MQTLTDKQKRQRIAIIIVSIIGLLSSLSFTLTVFAWGTGDATIFYLLLYPAFFVTTILAVTKVRFAYFLTIIFAFIYAILLNREIGNYIIFRSDNDVLLLVLVLPYMAFLTLIPLTTIFLAAFARQKKLLVTASFIIAFGFPTFAIAERFNMNYSDQIFIDAEVNEKGQTKLNCKPSFADTRTFILTTKSPQIADQIKKYGEYYQGSYFLQNTEIKKNYRFNKLKSVTIIKIGENILNPQQTWTTNEIKGDASFLQP